DPEPCNHPIPCPLAQLSLAARLVPGHSPGAARLALTSPARISTGISTISEIRSASGIDATAKPFSENAGGGTRTRTELSLQRILRPRVFISLTRQPLKYRKVTASRSRS